jgi:hypothetical protein
MYRFCWPLNRKEFLSARKHGTGDMKSIDAAYPGSATFIHSLFDKSVTCWNTSDVRLKEGFIELNLWLIAVICRLRDNLQADIITRYKLSRRVANKTKGHLCIRSNALGGPYQDARIHVSTQELRPCWSQGTLVSSLLSLTLGNLIIQLFSRQEAST